MDISKYIRDPSKIHSILKKDKASGVMTCTKECKIYIPLSYASKRLLINENAISIVGIFMIAVEDKYYGVSIANAMMYITPTETNIVTVEQTDEQYMEFTFKAGTSITQSYNLIQEKTLIYHIYNAFCNRGHTPWYFNTMDMDRLFDTSKYHADVSFGVSRAVLELIQMTRLRSTKDRKKVYRHVVTRQDDIENPNLRCYVGLMSVGLSVKGTIPKITGSYDNEALVASINEPSTKEETMDNILWRQVPQQ